MCVSLCHRTGKLYFNHEDCSPVECPFTAPLGACRDCRHRQGEICGLTRAALPANGAGCCHYNVELVSDAALIVTDEMIEPLGRRPGETLADVLDAYDVYYERDDKGRIIAPVDDLNTPETYGVGTEPPPEDEDLSFDWQDFDFEEFEWGF